MQVSPGNRSFFKYATPETALAILKNRTVRYSSPLFFNDPFDVQSGLHFDFDLASLSDKFLAKLTELATADSEPQVDPNDPWGQIVLLVRKHYPTHGVPRVLSSKRKTDELFSRLITEIKTTQKKYQEHWWNKLLPTVRVFCVSENRDNLLMWAHYAQDHTGAVFEFLSLPEEDNPLSVARPIQYIESPPPFFTEAEWLNDILAIQQLDMGALYRRYVYYKSWHWAHEREWRVWYPNIHNATGFYDDMPIRQSELAALYIGCKASDPFTTDAISLARKAFPSIKIFRARKREKYYALEYTEI